MTTGVNAKTCKLVVLDQRIQSLAAALESTKMPASSGSAFSTSKATGCLPTPTAGRKSSTKARRSDTEETGLPEEPEGTKKYVVSNVAVSVMAERVRMPVPMADSSPNLKDYTRAAVGKHYDTLDAFLRRWERPTAIIDELGCSSSLPEQVNADYGAFDLVCHVAFDQPPLTRKAGREREAGRVHEIRGTSPGCARSPAR